MQPVPIETIIQEIDGAISRLKDAPVIDQKKELMENIYPLLRMQTVSFTAMLTAVAEQCDANLIAFAEKLEETDAAIAEYLTGQESIILPDLSARIQAVLMMAISFCDAVDQAEVWGEYKMPESIEMQLRVLRGAAQEAKGFVESVTIEEPSQEDESGQG